MVTAFIAFWMVAFGFGQTAQAPASSPRMAAVAFAASHGFEIPRHHLVVATEVTFNEHFDTPRERGDRATTLSAEQMRADTSNIARFLGPDITTGSASGAVRCEKSRCYATSDEYVLAVDELKNSDPGVYIRLYWPSSAQGGRYMLSHVVVETTRSGDGWVGTRFTFGPKTGIVK
jgi:hypothetical protein